MHRTSQVRNGSMVWKKQVVLPKRTRIQGETMKVLIRGRDGGFVCFSINAKNLPKLRLKYPSLEILDVEKDLKKRVGD